MHVWLLEVDGVVVQNFLTATEARAAGERLGTRRWRGQMLGIPCHSGHWRISLHGDGERLLVLAGCPGSVSFYMTGVRIHAYGL